jgi:hypothetical protein
VKDPEFGSIRPLDEANLELLARVHPPDWRSPEPRGAPPRGGGCRPRGRRASGREWP